MTRVLRGFVLAVCICWLAACASGPHKALEASKQAQVTASEAVVGVKQEKLIVEIDPVIVQVSYLGAAFLGGPVAGAVSGLVSEAIESDELKLADKAAGPLRDQLAGFDFDGSALQGMQAELGKVAWLHLDKVTLTKDVSSAGYDKILDGTQAPYTLFVNEAYILTGDLQQLYVVARIVLLPKPTPGSTIRQGPNGTTYFMPPSDISNAVYINTVYYLTAIPEDAYAQFKAQVEASPPVVPRHGYVDIDRIAAARYWGQDGATPLKRALTEATSELGRLAALCLQSPGKPASFKDEVAVGIKEGHLLRLEGDPRAVIQFDDGSLVSVDTQLVKILRTGKRY